MWEEVRRRGRTPLFQFFPSCFLDNGKFAAMLMTSCFQFFPSCFSTHPAVQVEHANHGFQFFPSCFQSRETQSSPRAWGEVMTFNSFPVASRGGSRGQGRGRARPRPFNSFPVASSRSGTRLSNGGLGCFQFFPSCFLNTAPAANPPKTIAFNSFPVASSPLRNKP